MARKVRVLAWMLVGCVAVSVPALTLAQTTPPLEQPPQIPPGNPLTPAKSALGKALFWDEQLSLTGTSACGTCHRPQGAGADPRSALAGAAALHPGPDGLFGSADDIVASPGVPAHDSGGNYQPDVIFGLRPQVGKRKAGPVINAAYSPFLFWDGRANNRFVDPLTGVLVPGMNHSSALENQALAPLVNTSEMGHLGVGLSDVTTRIASLKPLALATEIPQPLDAWIDQRGYPALFAEAFGSAEITPVRLAMAIASYQRTLIADDTPIDDYRRGDLSALTALEVQGEQVFRTNDCTFCHVGPLFSDFDFHYIGVRPVNEDLGRFVESGENNERGSMLTPGLRGVGERAPYMHNGGLATLEEVVEFYNRGGDFSAPNKAGQVRPRNWTAQQKAALVAFLGRPLSDPRVAAEAPPFDRPTLYTESSRVPQIEGNGSAGTAGLVPQLLALEPPLRGNDNFTLVLSQALGSAVLRLVVSDADPGLVNPPPAGSFATIESTVGIAGVASLHVDLDEALVQPGQTFYARIYVNDPEASGGWAITPAARFTIFGPADDAIFAQGFEE